MNVVSLKNLNSHGLAPPIATPSKRWVTLVNSAILRRASIRCANFIYLITFLIGMCNPPSAGALETSLALISQGGDYVGQGEEFYYTDADATFVVQTGGRNSVSFLLLPQYWGLYFAAPNNEPLAVGVYVNAMRWRTPTNPALDVWGAGRGCNTILGAFQVKEITYGPGDTINSFWAIFEQHCEGSLPALFGEIRYNANTIVTLAVPHKKTVRVGTPLSFSVSANVTSGDVATIAATGLPPGASFLDNHNNTATFNWTPASNQTGFFVITFSAANAQGGLDTGTTLIAVGTLIRVPTDFTTIQAAIDSALDGSQILVSSGVYQENISFRGKWITVKSEEGPEVTILDGNQQDSVVTFDSGEDSDSVLDGFTVKNGRSYWDTPGYGSGGGIRVFVSGPTITHNVITENQACLGSGVAVESGSAIIEANVITRNKELFYCVGGFGGGISVVHGARVRIFNNIISNNSAEHGAGIDVLYGPSVRIEGNIIVDNAVGGFSTAMSGGGIWISGYSDAFVSQNLIAGNSAMYGGGVYWSVTSNENGPVFTNNTIADNDGQRGSDIHAEGFDSKFPMANNIIVGRGVQPIVYCTNYYSGTLPVLHFNNVYSPLGSAYGGACSDQTSVNGNISQDPLFVNSSQLDYRLSLASPAIDAGGEPPVPVPLTDLAGNARVVDGNGDQVSAIDMGAYEFTPQQPSRSDLTLLSLDLRAGVHVIINQSDINGATSGYTPFTRTYDNNTSVTVTAPTTVAGSGFQKWQRDGVDWDTNTTTQVLMNRSHAMTAIYDPLDTIAPDTIITDGPPMVMAGDATFAWTGTDNATPTKKLVYAYRLNPIDSKWSPFGTATTKTFSNLPSGSYYFSVKARDEAGNEDLDPPGWGFTVSPNPAPVAITTFSLPDGEAGAKYAAPLGVTGGRLPYSISVTSGSLPTGLSIVKQTIVGTPTLGGKKSFTLKVTDQLGSSVSKQFTLRIFPQLTISTSALAAGKVGRNYNKVLRAKSGKAPYSWSILSGSLPPGVTLNPSTGRITGKPTDAGDFNATFQVTDSLGGADQKVLMMTVK